MAPDPSPGVYALHDAADRPALLPDGTTSDLSVSTVLAPRSVTDAPPAVRPPQEPEALTADGGEREPAPSGRADS
jgi:NADH-quinone oxidoreductase subunit J